MKQGIYTVFCSLFLFAAISSTQAQQLQIDPECGTLGHAPCVPGINAPLVNLTSDTVSTQYREAVTNAENQPNEQTPSLPSNCGLSGLPPCVPGVNAPLPPKKKFQIISVPTSSTPQSFEILDSPYKLSITNTTEPLDIVVRRLPYSEAQLKSSVYQQERKLIPRAYEDPDVYGTASEDVFEIAFKRQQQPIPSLNQPFTFTLPWPDETYMKKNIYYWDGNKSNWFPLASSRSNFENKTVSADWHLPFGQFAVFDETTVFEGIASWYSYKGCNCAAIKEFRRGTKFIVTNITDESPRYGKSVTVTINDYGPAVWTKRLIDLDKTAFRQIASTWNGLALVRVELLN